MNLKITRAILITKKPANLDTVRIKTEEFRIAPENIHGVFKQENDHIAKINETTTRLISEAAIEFGAKTPRH